MKEKIDIACRIIFGLIFFVFGAAGLFQLMPPPPNLPPDMQMFMEGLAASGYFMILLKLTETICGLMLLLGVFVPLALVILAPVVLNILLVHIFLEHSGLPMALVLFALEIYLAFFVDPYKDIVKQIFRCPKMEAKAAVAKG